MFRCPEVSWGGLFDGGIGGRFPVFVHCAASSGLADIMGELQRCCGRRTVSAAEGIPSFLFPFSPSPLPARHFRCVCANTRNLSDSSQWPCIGKRTDFVRVHSRQSSSPARCAGLAPDIAPPPRAPPAQAPRAASRPPARGACLRATRVRRPVRPREPAVGRGLAVVVRRGVDPALAVAVVALGRRACGGGSVTCAERDRPRCSPGGGARDDRGRCKALPEASAPVGREPASRSAAESRGHGRALHGQASPPGRAVRAGAAPAAHAVGILTRWQPAPVRVEERFDAGSAPRWRGTPGVQLACETRGRFIPALGEHT